MRKDILVNKINYLHNRYNYLGSEIIVPIKYFSMLMYDRFFIEKIKIMHWTSERTINWGFYQYPIPICIPPILIKHAVPNELYNTEEIQALRSYTRKCIPVTG